MLVYTCFVGYEDTATEQSAGTQSVLLQTDVSMDYTFWAVCIPVVIVYSFHLLDNSKSLR